MGKLKIGSTGFITMENGCADKLIASGNGDAALLYIYILRCGGEVEPADAARALGIEMQRIEKATEALKKLGLIDGGESAAAPAEEEKESLSGDEMSDILNSDSVFHGLCGEAERLLGRKLAEMDLRRLLGIYRAGKLNSEAIVLLVSSCCAEYAEKHGPGKVPSMAAIEREAKVWADRDISTAEDAEAYLAKRSELRSGMGTVCKALGLGSRKPAPTERRFIEAWLEAGFDCDMIEKAYDITVTRTGSLAWKYMDTIIQNWQSKGLYTLEAVEAGDKPSEKKKPEAKAAEEAPVGETREQRAMRRTLEWKEKHRRQKEPEAQQNT